MALGMVPEEIFDYAIQDKTVPFGAGDVLVLYTDGVTEAVNSDGIEFGNGRLADVVRTLRSRPAREIVDGVLDRITLFSGQSRQVDDFTVFILKRND
jgi:sigma-B regulation protein RsbU (phosphoserine phosphatase)